MLVARLLPKKIYNRVYPGWVRMCLVFEFWRRQDRKLYFSRPILSWVAVKKIKNCSMLMVVRSYRELRRLRNLGGNPQNDLVFRWLTSLDDCSVFYDIGASNGVFGFAAHYLHHCKTVFIEPYTPSIESILKSIYIAVSQGSQQSDFEVVHAGLDKEETYSRLNMHTPPMPGVTLNSFKDSNLYDNIVSRSGTPVTITQWIKGVSLDELIFKYDLPVPTCVKMDIDGFEGRGIEGAKRLIESRQVHSWAIEINSQANLESIKNLMEHHGYHEISHQAHHPFHVEYQKFPADYLFVRDDLLLRWSDFS